MTKGRPYGEEVGARIRRALEVLTPEQKEVFLLRTEAELSFKAIASVVGCPLGTALGRMRDALLKLREVLRP